MERNIEINQNDVYRAKIENSFDEKSFFSGVYNEALHAIDEILSINIDCLVNGKNDDRFWGMGNNIVAFIASRGQGKTSVLQSCAGFLREWGECSCSNEIDKLEYFDKCNFEVLETIDPSFLNVGESLIRVMVSRLFKIMDDTEYWNDQNNKDSGLARKKKYELVKLFRECFDNIDYIHVSEGKREEDDIEYLFKLGNSTGLKKNLKRLVEEYLKIRLRNKKKKEYSFLIIPIDDMDLASADVFKLCEDIRNYFSIPNVVVLMAADFEQLKNSIYQNYLKQYECLIGMSSDKQLYIDNCMEMSSRYLEKMLPAGRLISLPDVAREMIENSNHFSLKFYHDNDRKVFDELCFAGNDIQEQLIKLLYHKTGIIICKRSTKIHPLLPHSMRELGHFLKMLLNMENLNLNWIFKNEEAVHLEVRRIQKNLSQLKEYFLNYWLSNRLEECDYNKIVKLDGNIQKYGMKKALCIYAEKEFFIDGKTDEKTKGHIDFLAGFFYFFEKRKDENINFYEAFSILYTINLNEMFALALERNDKFEEIKNFLERPFYIPSSMKEALYLGKYRLWDFRVNMTDDIDKESDDDREASNTDSVSRPYPGDVQLFLKYIAEWCTGWVSGIRDSNRQLPVFVFPNNEPSFNGNVEFVEFNVLNGFWHLWECNPGSGSTWELDVDGGINKQTSSEGLEYEQDQSADFDRVKFSLRLMVKNIIANFEIYSGINKSFEEKGCFLLRKTESTIYANLFKDLFDVLDNWTDWKDIDFLQCNSDIGNIMTKKLTLSNFWETLFLFNVSNLNEYIKTFKENIQNWKSGIIQWLEDEDVTAMRPVTLNQKRPKIYKELADFESHRIYIERIDKVYKKFKKIEKEYDDFARNIEDINKDNQRVDKQEAASKCVREFKKFLEQV